MMNAGKLKGQVAVVTGGGRGIGREIASQLAAAGASVAVTARTATQLAETQEIIEAAGGTCFACPMDVADPQQVKNSFKEIAAELGPVDLLVNNAGMTGEPLLPWEQSDEDWWRVQEVNLRGPHLCSKAVIPGMIQRGSGRIIMMGSHVAMYPMAEVTAYSVSKAALTRLTDSLAVGLKEHGISVFVISPGLVKTEMTKDIPEDFVKVSGWTPVEKAGQLCLRLASGEADVLTGRYIHASLHDLDELIACADEIVEKDVQALRFVE